MQIFTYLRRHAWLGNSVLLLSTIMILLLVAEIAFRINGKYAVYSEKHGDGYTSIFTPGEKNWYHVYPVDEPRTDNGPEFSYTYLANNEGLLEKDFTEAKDSNTIRIMVLGDSFIQGIGAPYDSSCLRQLERILKKEITGTNIEVWDCGVGGSDPFFEFVLLRKLMKYKPDYVVLALNTTDITDVIIRGGMERFNADSTVSYAQRPWMEPLYGKSFVVRRVMHDILGYNWLFLREKDQKVADQKSIDKIKNVLVDFKQLCDTSHIPLLVSFQPIAREFDSTVAYSMLPFLQFCDSVKMKAVDLKTYLQTQGYTAEKVKPLYWPIDGHFNSVGYGLYAQMLCNPIEKDIKK